MGGRPADMLAAKLYIQVVLWRILATNNMRTKPLLQSDHFCYHLTHRTVSIWHGIPIPKQNNQILVRKLSTLAPVEVLPISPRDPHLFVWIGTPQNQRKGKRLASPGGVRQYLASDLPLRGASRPDHLPNCLQADAIFLHFFQRPYISLPTFYNWGELFDDL